MPGLGSSVARAVAAKSSDMPPGVCLDSASNATTAVGGGIATTANGKPKLDSSDPRVKKLVYSMYRDMLTTYNGEANDIINKKDPAIVTQDLGVGPILESIIIRQRSSQGGGGDGTGSTSTASEGLSEGGTSNGTTPMAPPPPPPPMMPGSIPAVRLSSEIGPRDKGPPAALAGAMMKDKKPFTYTPGGIDLSEIRSPRMAKRIQMNAAAEGVTNVPTPSSSNQERAPCNLPPAALAAMQPQMAIPVFPQGNINAVQLNKMHKPADYAGGAPPPPPPPPMMQVPVVRPQMPPAPPSPQPTLQPSRHVSSPQPKSPPPPPTRTPPPQMERVATPKSPVPMMDSHFGLSPPISSPSNLHDEKPERRSPLERKSPISAEAGPGVGTGSLFIPPIQNTTQQQGPPPPPSLPPSSPVSNYVPPSSRPTGQTKAQAVSQNIGSLYIPPIGAQQADIQQSGGSSGSTTNGNQSVSRTPQSAQVIPNVPQTASSIPATPQLNKAPTPWMNSYNRIQNQQADSPPYVHPGFFMPPWGPPPGARTIPIMMPRESDQMDGASSPFPGGPDSRRSSSASGGSTPSGSRTPSQAATHLGRVIPIQIEREEAGRAKGAKIIPIQIEGRPPRGMTPATPTTPMMNPMRRAVGPPPYNSPMGLYSNQNVMDAYQRQAAEAAAGVDRMNVRCESPRTDPMQSKSLRVIQQAAENELKRIEQERQESLDMSEDDRHLMSLFMSQVDEGSSLHQTAEPRFMGGHIPSKAFRALQTALPSSPAGAQDQPPPSYPAAQPGAPVTHHIPIRQVAQSPTPQSQASEILLSSQANVPPSEQRVQEPRKYMGSNIPSRSFKILQAMTAEDGQPVEGSAETCATEQNIADAYNEDIHSLSPLEYPNVPLLSPSYSSSSYPLSLSSSEGGGSATFDPYNNNVVGNNLNGNDNPNSQNPWSDIMDQGWDPYTYMWYYWWYYTSCYWAGYDMTGYEYPPGWDPNYPYCPPELFSDYSAFSEYTGAEAGESTASSEETTAELMQERNLERECSSSADLHKSLLVENGIGEESYYGQDNDDNNRRRMMMSFIENNSRIAASSLSSSVPKIVIEDGDMEAVTESAKFYRESRGSVGKNNSGSVDSIKDNNNGSGSSLCNNNNNNNNNNHNDSTTGKAPYTNPLTECNQKPGNPTSLSRKRNDCDSVVVAGEMWKIEDKFAESKQQLAKNGNDNDVDEKRAHKEKAYEDNQDSSASSSDDEYESCCEDSEQKVIERETGLSSNNNKPFVTSSTSENLPTPTRVSESTEQQESQQRKFEFHANYNGELNANEYGEKIKNGQGKREKAEQEEGGDDDDEDEKTDPGTDEDNDEEDDYEGRSAIIEEPETPSSADDSDVTPLASEIGQGRQRAGKSSFDYGGGLSIEEYHSENSSSESAVFDYGPKKNRLSTIDEITESRASSSVFSRGSGTPTVRNLSAEFDYGANKNNSYYNGSGGNLINEEKSSHQQNNAAITTGESDESEESSDELSSVSVIENKSDATRGTTEESKREDETTSTSDEDSSTDDDDNNVDYEEEDDDDEAGGADTAVTVRLPLKLCFTKTKSYKDITTVMVGDSEIEESSQASTSESNEQVTHTTCNANDNLVSEDSTFPVDETDDEPVVSFTLSLSRQTSREDDNKARDGMRSKGCNEKKEKAVQDTGKMDAPDIDFWAEITKGKAEEKSGSSSPVTTTANVDEIKSNQEAKEGYNKENKSEADVGFWGVICRDRSASDFRIRSRRKQNERADENCNQNGLSHEQVKMRTRNEDKQDWDPYERIDYKWEKDFNFWEKSSRTIEPRRFSGNFEITEDYESDSGIKPTVERKEKVKKYTHKRHSIPGPCSGWDRSALPPRPAGKQSTSNFSTNHSQSNCNEQEIKIVEGKFRGSSNNNRTMKQEERRTCENNESLYVRKIVDSYHEDSTSSWWTYWDEVTQENDENEKFENNEDNSYNSTAANGKQVEPGASSRQENNSEIEGTAESQEEEKSVDVSVEMKLSEGSLKERNGKGESTRCTSKEGDYQSFASMQASRMEGSGSGGFSSLERMEDEAKHRKSLNHSCQSDATTETPDNEDCSSSPEIKCSLLFPSVANQEAEKLIQQGSAYVSVSDENSDESSSRSSGTTIGQNDKSEIKKQILGSALSTATPPPPPPPAAPSSSDVGTDNETRHLDGYAVEKEEVEEEDEEGEEEEESTQVPVDTSVHIPVSIEKCVQIQHEAVGGKIKLDGKEHYHHHHHHHDSTCTATASAINTTSSSGTTTTTTTTCTCLMSDRIARAENLLWRIERFLHESLSLGSEDDSGVMTDLSRQISDVDTDVDNDMNETEFLLTAAAAAKERRGMASATTTTPANSNNRDGEQIESCNFGETISSTDASMHHHAHQQQTGVTSSSSATPATTTCSSSTSSQVKKPRPKSDIFLESTLLSKVETEETTSSSTVVEESNGVKMRSASERRALRYQRAKTHSRLFQLLQDECGRDEDQDEFDYDSDIATPTTTTTAYKTTNSNMAGVDCQINVDANGSSSDFHYHHRSPTSCKSSVENDDSNNGESSSSPTRMNDALARRSRLLPLPIKNLLASSLSLDSNSSPSGSSGVLSPTSPVNRDQLLADIINEFHLRNQASTVRAQNQRRISSSFPSKIFKLLQHEFGEEFYQTFDCCGGGSGEDSLISPSASTHLCVNDSSTSSEGAPFVHECTIHKSESMKEFEEATNRILTNFMLRNTSKQNKTGCCQSLSESPSCTANLSSHSLQDDSKNTSSVDFLDVPLRKKKATLNRDPRSSKSTKKS